MVDVHGSCLLPVHLQNPRGSPQQRYQPQEPDRLDHQRQDTHRADPHWSAQAPSARHQPVQVMYSRQCPLSQWNSDITPASIRIPRPAPPGLPHARMLRRKDADGNALTERLALIRRPRALRLRMPEKDLAGSHTWVTRTAVQTGPGPWILACDHILALPSPPDAAPAGWKERLQRSGGSPEENTFSSPGEVDEADLPWPIPLSPLFPLPQSWPFSAFLWLPRWWCGPVSCRWPTDLIAGCSPLISLITTISAIVQDRISTICCDRSPVFFWLTCSLPALTICSGPGSRFTCHGADC